MSPVATQHTRMGRGAAACRCGEVRRHGIGFSFPPSPLLVGAPLVNPGTDETDSTGQRPKVGTVICVTRKSGSFEATGEFILE